MKPCLLFSGGLDSAAAWWVTDKPNWLSFHGANRGASDYERNAVERLKTISSDFASSGEIIEFDFTPFMRPDTWNYHRETVMVMLAWARGYDKIMAAWTADDLGSEAAIKTFSKFLTSLLQEDSERPGEFIFPVARMYQHEIVARAIKMGCPEEFILGSHSCVRYQAGHCGSCLNCLNRWVTLLSLGIKDPSYIHCPTQKKIKDYVRKNRGTIPGWMDAYRRAYNIPEGSLVLV